MSEVFSILLHNRQRYEQGKEGLWFSLPTTTEKLQEALRGIGISADNPQDFFLYDYRSPQERPIMLRCTPIKGDYQFYCYCYRRENFEKECAEQRKNDRSHNKKKSEPER